MDNPSGHVQRIRRGYSETRGLNGNLDKTVIMTNAKEGGDIKLGSNTLKKVDSYKYLGRIMSFEDRRDKSEEGSSMEILLGFKKYLQK